MNVGELFFRCALTAKAICTGPLANPELATVEQLAEAIAATISRRINTSLELQHAQWLTDTMTSAGVEMYHHHTEPTLLRVGDDNLCAVSLGQEDEEFADTLRLAVALTSPVALLRAIRLSPQHRHLPHGVRVRPLGAAHPPLQPDGPGGGKMGGDTGHNQIRRVAIGLRKKARKTAAASLAMRATGRPIYTLTLQLTAHHHSIIGGTRGTDRTEQGRKRVSTTCGKIKAAPAPAPTERRPADTSPAPPPAGPKPTAATSSDPSSPDHTPTQADDEEELELNYEDNDGAMDVDTDHRSLAETPAHPSQPTPGGKGTAATKAKLKKKQPRGCSRSDGATRNRSRSKPRLCGTRGSDSEWEGR
eukprot:jgi/Tetstr1/462669/TSEL_000696.t1